MRYPAFVLLFTLPLSLLAQTASEINRTELAVSACEVFFASGKAELPDRVDSILSPCIAVLGEDASLRLRVRAHTDAIGSVPYNKDLSERRAAAVLDQLFKLGLDSSQVIAQGLGEEEPQASNATEEGRQANRRATIEIFKPVRLLPLRGEVVDTETQEPVAAKIIIRGRYFRDSIHTDSLGKYETLVPENSNLVVETFAEGYLFETTMLRVKSMPMVLPKIELPKIKPGLSFDLKNFYFVGNQAVLLDKSKPELNRLLNFMVYNPAVHIEIAGHVNHPNNPPLTKDTWEYRLSVERAKMVYDFLLGQGIPAGRMTYQGYGNWQMRFPHARTAKEQELNRRVEIKIQEGASQ